MIELVQKAQNRLKEIEEEAARLRVFLAVAGELKAGASSDKAALGEDSVLVDDDPDTASPAEIVEAARLLMRERARPLSRSALVKALRAEGLKLPGADPAKNVGTVIWRSKQFDNVAGYGYWPKDMPRWIGQRQRALDVD